MILPDFVLPNRMNQHWQFSGIDSFEKCMNQQHFLNFPYEISYDYNSRGYRDQEWPDSIDQLKTATWCVGDSFTVGIGSPREHTWTYLLSQETEQRTINVSMDGASNNWIAKKVLRIIDEIQPNTLVVHWSYIARRELDLETALDQLWDCFYAAIRDASWPDCDRQHMNQLPEYILNEINTIHGGWNNHEICDSSRILQSVPCSDDEDIENTLTCIDLVNKSANSTKVVHSFIPEYVPKKFKGVIESKISGLVIPEINRLDLARDGHHYDLKTSCYFVDQIVPLLT